MRKTLTYAIKAGVLLLLVFGLASGLAVLRERGCRMAVCPRTGDRIESVEADATVHADGTVTVNEKITYIFGKPQQGLHRDVMTSYHDAKGWHRVPTVMRTVRDADNVVIAHQDENAGTALRVWIGSPDDVHQGKQTFQMSYVMNGGVHDLDGTQAFTWDLLGFDQALPVDSTTASVTVEGVSRAAELAVACKGLGDVQCSTESKAETWHFSAKGPLTLSVALPEGTAAQLVAQPINEAASALPFVVPALTFLWLAVSWLFQGTRAVSRWRLLFVPPLAALPYAYARIMEMSPRFSVHGSAPNAIAAAALTVAIYCMFQPLLFLTAQKSTPL